MTDARRRVPTEAEWRRLDSSFAVFFLVTLTIAVIFIAAAPFPPVVGAGIMAPVVVPTGWIWIMVIRRRDEERMLKLIDFAARRRSRRRGRRG